MKISDKLMRLREYKNITQQELAKIAGVSDKAVSTWEQGTRSPKLQAVRKICAHFGLDLNTFVNESNDEFAPMLSAVSASIVDHPEPYKAPIVGTIPAGYPAVALEDIGGYEPIPYSNAEDYIFLRVSGDSMINADIRPDDLVLIRRQSTAEPGQIVACIVNGDEATLKRYRPAPDGVYLMPENSAYAPRRVDYEDFENGYANIIGVAIEVRHKL